ncbi:MULTISPECIES: carboxypeptidase-like regulatory domain-containing protein [Bacteroides]|jgi:hypothetical protein|uniref:carboxypeptidase-like regulatory domain-containing protein n=1 Tax=Bacteroides TaxID=816 RepID=UPI000E47E6C0|nr:MULTISPECIES: carboxypeptidase-like regulatory domain-containing protein [Bacteroides]QNL40206.1 carboxypeptidase-like regulatory domain-containing protein [Bacteroides sp. M10]RGQ91550.1 hypothetical protein DWY71_22465 [Bacteroides sp. AF26-7BH]RGY29932.1 hypothetical protein DXA46_22165 [Bacteroides sp. OF02-3LB]
MKENLGLSRTIMVFLMAMLCFPWAIAQTITVTGTVMDSEKEPLIGVSVVQKNARTNGVATNSDGKFTIKVPQNATLIFSYIGYMVYNEHEATLPIATVDGPYYRWTDVKNYFESIIFGVLTKTSDTKN